MTAGFKSESPAGFVGIRNPGRGRTKTGQLWAYARDDRPWGGTDPPGVAYVYAPDRTTGRPIAHLSGFAGGLQVDGYAAYETLAKSGAVRLAYCWSHVRRQFYDLAAASPIAAEALSRIAALYRIEAEIRGCSAEERQAAWQERSRPVVEALEAWLREKLGLLSRKSNLAAAIRYALSHWAGLSLFLDDGRVEIDSNTVERTIRPLALNRKNALIAGSNGGGEHRAVITSLIETCKLVGVEPQPTSPTSSPALSTTIRSGASTSFCPGPTRAPPRSKPWPDNAAALARQSDRVNRVRNGASDWRNPSSVSTTDLAVRPNRR